jgi:hypothetical protein
MVLLYEIKNEFIASHKIKNDEQIETKHKQRTRSLYSMLAPSATSARISSVRPIFAAFTNWLHQIRVQKMIDKNGTVKYSTSSVNHDK